MAAPRTDARYDRGRIEAVPHGRVAAPDCLVHMCHHVHAADEGNLHLALLQTNDHSTVPGPVMALVAAPIGLSGGSWRWRRWWSWAGAQLASRLSQSQQMVE